MNIMIVLNYNDYKTTLSFIEKMKNYEILDKIIVVDNCSTDNSYLLLKKLRNNKIDIISTEKNNGYGSGNNEGILFAEKEYLPKNIIISNPDIDVSEKSIINICNYLDRNDNVAAATGLIHNKKNEVVKNFAWKLPNYKMVLTNTFMSTSKFFEVILNKSQNYNRKLLVNDSLKVDVLSGCFFVIKQKNIKDIGYFDEKTFLYCEENIISYKLKGKGYEQMILCNEKIIHEHGVSISKSIKSWKRKYEILNDSYNIYLMEYLNVSKFQQHIFNILFNIGKYEKYIIQKTRKIYLMLIKTKITR